MRKMLWGAALLSAVSLTAGAQVCTGTPSYGVGRFRAGLGIGKADHVSRIGAELGTGSATGGFISGSVASYDYDGSDAGRSSFGVNAGYAVDMNAKRTAQFCPLIGYSYSRGPDAGNFTSRTHELSVGGSVGGSATINRTVDALPFFSAVLVRDRTNFNAPGVAEGFTVVNYGLWTAGVGLAFNRTFSIQPAISRPFNIDHPETLYSLGFTINFGDATRR